jgi:hypothetical protein
MESELKWPTFAIVVFLSGILGYATLTRGHDWGDDFASYIMQAQSIAEGSPAKFIEENRFTIERSVNEEGIGPVAYPWGTPLLLAPVYKRFGLNLLALKVPNLLFYFLFLALIAVFFSKRHPPVDALLMMFLFAFNPRMLLSLDDVLSDLPFLFFSTTTLLLIGRVFIARRPFISPLADSLLLGTLFAATCFIRLTGVLLVLTAAGAQVLSGLQRLPVNETAGSGISNRIRSVVSSLRIRGIKNLSIDVLSYVAFIGLTGIWFHIFPHQEAGQVPDLAPMSPLKFYWHLHYYLDLPADFFDGSFHPNVIYGITLPFLLVGVVKRARDDYHILVYACLTVLFYLFLPFTGGLRYVFPLLPFYIHFVFVGLRWYCQALGGRWTRIIQNLSGCLWAVVIFYFLHFTVSHALDNIRAQRKVSSGPFAETSQAMFSFVRGKTSEDSVIVFFKPRAMRMLTHRRSIRLESSTYLSRGDYLCVYLQDGGYVQIPDREVQELARAGKLKPVYANSDFRLYQILDLGSKSVASELRG